VPECCGLVWNAVRAQQARASRHVAIYWDGSIRLEVGVELYGPFAEEGEVVRSATPAGPVEEPTAVGGGMGTLLLTSSADAWNTALCDNLSFDYVRDIVPSGGQCNSKGSISIMIGSMVAREPTRNMAGDDLSRPLRFTPTFAEAFASNLQVV
jgi:hypothetical protein